MRLRSGHELEQRDYLPDRSSAIMLGLVAPRVLPVVEDLAAGDVPAEVRPLEDDIGECGRLGDRREMASRSRRRQLRGPAGQHRQVGTALALQLGFVAPVLAAISCVMPRFLRKTPRPSAAWLIFPVPSRPFRAT